MTPLIHWASKIASADGKYDFFDFQWFDATNIMQDYFTGNVPVDVTSEIINPMPFPKMFICLMFKGNKIIMRVEEEEDSQGGLFCTVAALGQTLSGQAKQLGAFAIFKNNGVVNFQNLQKELTTDTDIKNSSVILAVFQNRLAKEKTVVYQPQIRNTYTNQRLMKKGKPPTFEWRMVTIESKVVESTSHGGTHASPRLHDRRGHWRTMKKSGKRFWVRDCKVGDPSKGIIKHDYKFKPMEATT